MPLTKATYILFTCLFFICSDKFICALSFFAITNKPDVSLSILCTIPGLISPPIPERLSSQ